MNKLLTNGWLAKDEDGRVWSHPTEPRLIKSANGRHYWICGNDATFVGRYAFPETDWRDKPKFCDIRIEIRD